MGRYIGDRGYGCNDQKAFPELDLGAKSHISRSALIRGLCDRPGTFAASHPAVLCMSVQKEKLSGRIDI